MSPTAAISKTVAVLGASYGGASAAQVLAKGLPNGWRLVVVDRNTHLNHLYVLPRYAVVPGHEHKAFIPYKDMLKVANPSRPEHVILHAQALGFTRDAVHLSRAFPEHGIEGQPPALRYDYMIYALGSHLPAPIDLWGPVDDPKTAAAVKEGQVSRSSDVSAGVPVPLTNGTKPEGIQWLKRFHERIDRAPSVLVVGGGALGVQYATDVAEAYPTKSVTLLHSRTQLLPRFSQGMHDAIISRASALNIDLVLGDRLDLSSLKGNNTVTNADGTQERIVRTQSGREIRSALVLLCTGQTPNTALMAKLLPDAVVPDGPYKGMLRVKPTMQVAVPGERQGALTVPYPHLFAIGDSADAFGAVKNGRNSGGQAMIAANNILKMIQHSESQSEGQAALDAYTPDPPGIKLSLGLTHWAFDMAGTVSSQNDGEIDMSAAGMWRLFGVEFSDDVNA